MLERLFGGTRPRPALRPVRPDRGTGEAGRRAAAIADEVFAAAPDTPLHLAIRIGKDSADRLAITWTNDPIHAMARRPAAGAGTDAAFHRVPMRDDHLLADGEAAMAEAARWIMGEELRRRAIQSSTTDQDATPPWSLMVSPLLADAFTRLDVRLGDSTAGATAQRLQYACRQRGAVATLLQRGHLLHGRLTMPADAGRPHISIETESGVTDHLRITRAALADTILLALAGRPLSTLVDLGPQSADMTIVDVQQDQWALKLRLTGDAVTLAPVPPGVDDRWVPLVAEDMRP